MPRGSIVNPYYWQADKMSQVLGGTLGLVAASARPTLKDYWKAMGMSQGPIVNPYYWQVDNMSQVLGGTLGLLTTSGRLTLKDY